MTLEFIVVISSHRKLGVLLLPYLIERKTKQTYFQLIESLTIRNYNNYEFQYTEEQLKIIKHASEYSEQNIYKLYCKNKNLKEFYDTLDERLLQEFIRPFIEKRIAKCINILKQSNIKIYKKERKYQVIHDEEEVFIEKETVQPLFNFIKTSIDFKYYLSLQTTKKELKLFNNTFEVLSNYPSIILINNIIYCINEIDSKKLLPFFKKDHISVPKTSEKSYINTFVKNSIIKYPYKTVGFQVEENYPDGKAILQLDSGLSGEPVFLLFFEYNNVKFRSDDSSNASVEIIEKEEYFYLTKINRSFQWEKEMIKKLDQYELELYNGNSYYFKFLEGENTWKFYEILSWLNYNIDKLKNDGFTINKGQFEKDYYINPLKLDIQLDVNSDWFDVHAIVTIGEFKFPFTRFRKHIIMGIREFTLPNNQVVILPSTWFSKYKDIFIYGTDDENTIKFKKHHFQILRKSIGQEAGKKIFEIKNKLTINKSHHIVPEGIRLKLRDYQIVGLNWLYQLYKNNLGGCLADDMGLGKTIQTIALIQKIKEEERTSPAPNKQKTNNQEYVQLSLFDIPSFWSENVKSATLIVMPVSLIHNWENEIKRIAPNLYIYKFYGTQRTRDINDLSKVDIILTSYGVVRNDVELLSQLKFKYIILDESQIIKNPDSKIYKAVLSLQSEHKLVLTGTPIENSLTDLWAQLNFLNRNMLKSLEEFKEEFVTPIEKHNDIEKQKKLQFIINPFILRRKKEDVVKELPPVTEQVVYCDMTDEQKEIYDKEKSAARNLIMEYIDNKGIEKSSIIILKALNRLRLISNHPALVFPDYNYESGKYEEITRNIVNIIEESHKVLIFSSYVKHLNLISSFLSKEGYSYAMLTGATQNRQQIINSFQKNDDQRVFLISLKAGGIGLNLTAADYAFIIDPWWNPAAEEQAISRSHRIGQSKKVFVYRFITNESVEEKIVALQKRKSKIADIFINSNNPFKIFNKEEILDLFK